MQGICRRMRRLLQPREAGPASPGVSERPPSPLLRWGPSEHGCWDATRADLRTQTDPGGSRAGASTAWTHRVQGRLTPRAGQSGTEWDGADSVSSHYSEQFTI